MNDSERIACLINVMRRVVTVLEQCIECNVSPPDEVSTMFEPGRCVSVDLEWYLAPGDAVRLRVFPTDVTTHSYWTALHGGKTTAGIVKSVGLPMDFILRVNELVQRGQAT